MRCVKANRRLGGALIETLITLGIVVTFLACNYGANSKVWSLVKASVESNAANRTLTGRAEQLRACTWAQVTDAAYLRDTVLAATPDVAGDLASLGETIDVIASPMPSPSTPSLQVTRNNTTGTVTVVGAGNGGMPLQTGVRVNLTANWISKGGKSHTRQITMFFAQGGLSGRH